MLTIVLQAPAIVSDNNETRNNNSSDWYDIEVGPPMWQPLMRRIDETEEYRIEEDGEVEEEGVDGHLA